MTTFLGNINTYFKSDLMIAETTWIFERKVEFKIDLCLQNLKEFD